jgi:hypothetical protein
MAAPTEQDVELLRQALAETLEAIERVREAVSGPAGRFVSAPVELPGVIREDRPGESLPMLEQEAADLRRDIKAMEAEIARDQEGRPLDDHPL